MDISKLPKKMQEIMTSIYLYIFNFISLADNSFNLVPFKLHVEQRYLLENLGKFNIISKARQLGISVAIKGFMLMSALTKDNTNYLIVSHSEESANELWAKLKTMNNSMDKHRKRFPNLVPKTVIDNRDELSFDNGSRIRLAVAGNKDLGRGATYEIVLLSEFAFYSDQERILVGVEQALAKSNTSKIVIESTSNGMNHFYDMVSKASKGTEFSKYKLFFFPFYAKGYEQLYAADYEEAVEDHINNHGKMLTKEDLTKHELRLFEDGASLTQLVWRRYKLKDMNEKVFEQEFPSSWQSSFISKDGDTVFDQEKIIDDMRHVSKYMTKQEVREWILNNPNKPFVDSFESLVKHVEKSLFIYKMPEPHVYMFGGCDVAAGYGGDDSAIAIYDEEGEQVAVFKSNRQNPKKFAKIINKLGEFYNYAFMVVESNTYGQAVLQYLTDEDIDYPNLYKEKRWNGGRKSKSKVGQTTTATTKSRMISDFKEQWDEDLLKVNDVETLQQMQIFIHRENGSTGNKKGRKNKDDLVIASALANVGFKTGNYYVDIMTDDEY
ncbi:terminase large subunit domain-containing protein [Alkalihalobacillus sp. NPDC078783]|uniref:terminase large subunit domain-containing protein n=1 Tax=Streptomyces albidoflavus TaxID=1886 RepID=UPI0033DAFB34